MRPARYVRAVLLIGVATLALAVVAGRVALPVPAPHAVSAGSSPPSARATPTPGRRPIGTSNIMGDVFTSPELQGDERGLLETLIRRGVDIERVDPASWDNLFDQAYADAVMTDSDQFFVFAPEAPGHPRWVCPAQIEGAIIGGGDADSYEIAIGGDRATIQLSAPDLSFWTFGEVIVAAPTARSAKLIASVARPATCPIGQ